MTSPVRHTVTLEPSGDTFSAAPGQRLLEAARVAGRWLPFECGWGSCGTCKATLVSGDVEQLYADAPASSERDARRGRILLCQTAAASDVTLRPLRVDTTPPPERHTRTLTGRVESVTELGPGIVELRVDVGEPIEFRPGQFAILQRPDGVRRCYSLAGEPSSSLLRFVLKHHSGSEVSHWLAQRDSGDELVVEAPYGDVWVRPGARPLLLVAGGTGISAILGLARAAAAGHRDRLLTVVYGARRPDELVLLDELRSLVATHGGGQVVAVAEDPAGAPDLVPGRVTDVLVDLSLAEHDVYLAGPPPMVDAVDALLVASGCQRDTLFVDRFG
jgi:toluene monooxygenase electron transfer component